MSSRFRLSDARFEAFHDRNPDVDVRTLHVHDPEALRGLDFTGMDRTAMVADLACMQRLLDVAGGHEPTAALLAREGFTSANHIARISPRRFADRMQGLLDAEQARSIHTRAKATKAITHHVFANVRGLVGSPYYRSTRFGNVGDDVIRYYEGIPSYQSLFGRLDYLKCEHCRSIFGPTAYFVDIMRVVDEYITYPNRATIPSGMKLEERRPDLFDLPLTCENADTPIPYLQLVNEVLSARIRAQHGTDAFEVLATAPYPFGLPFHAPLAALRTYVERLGTTLVRVYETLPGPAASGTARGGTSTSIELAAATGGSDDWYAGMEVSLTAGPGAGERRRIVSYDSESQVATVDRPFTTTPTSATVYAIDDTLDVARERLRLSAEQLAFVTTPSPGTTAVGAAYGYVPPASLADALQPRADGEGTVSFVAGSRDVGGTGTDFPSQIAVGSQILAAGQIRTVTAVTGPTALTVDAPWTEPAASAAWSYLQWFARPGTIQVTKGSAIVTGTGTSFDATMSPGDQIQAAGTVRTVQSISSATSLVVDVPYPADAGPVAYAINPAANLDRVSVFLARTGSSYDALTATLRQGLSDAELASIGDTLFINATGEGLPPLVTRADSADPSAQVQRIVGLSLARLDRFTRFERLRSILGWTAEDLDWVIRATGESEITPAVVDALGATARLAEEHALPIDVVVSFFHDVKTIGVGDGSTRRDPFDRVFNDPALLEGQDPYTSPSVIPFDPARPLTWTIDDRGQLDAMSRTIRARLTAALGVTDDALTVLARWTAALQGRADTLELDLGTLSWLYRLAIQARVAKLEPSEYLALLWLLLYPEQPSPVPPEGAVPATLTVATAALAAARWAAEAGLGVAELAFILTGVAIEGFQPGVTQDAVDALVDAVARDGRLTRLTTPSFAFQTIDADALFEALDALGLVTAAGVVGGSEISYASLKVCFLISAASLVTPDISETEAQASYDALVDHDDLVPTLDDPSESTLAEGFSESSSLAFLFPDDPPEVAAAKQGQVRDVLLQVRRNIDHTVAVLDRAKAQQDEQVMAGLAQFFAVDAAAAGVLLELANGSVDLALLRADLLTPPTAPAPAALVERLAKTERDVLWARRLEMSAAELAAIVSNPAPFSITSPQALTYASLVALWAYRASTLAFDDTEGDLLRYFDTTDGAARVQILADLTGWSPAQIEELTAFLWPESSGRASTAVTVVGVEAMHAAFALAKEGGVDISWLVSLTDLRHLPVGAIGAPVSEAAWSIYEQRAGEALDAVSARVGAADFPAVAAELTDATNVQQRDGLLGYSVWQWSQTYPSITSPTGLYQHLLLDVEMGGCARTSRIAQGIGSVQLYMQRVRMSLEPGVDVIDVDPTWWSWLSEYRKWEVNRRIFVYPESYVDPGLRSSATPLFRSFIEAVTQTDLGQAGITDAFLAYFDGLSQLAALVPAGAYRARPAVPTVSLLGTRRTGPDVLYWFGRSVIKPYAYHMRTYDERHGWSPWSKVDLTIGSPFIAPVHAFDRLFAFWTTFDHTTTSNVTTGNANSQFFTTATTQYSFIDATRRWVQPQVLADAPPIDVGPMNYSVITGDARIGALYDTNGIFWQLPYPLRIAPGILGTGTVTFVEGLANVSGNDTAFNRELREGDIISAGGQQRRVLFVEDDGELVVTEPWTFSTKDAQYKILRTGEHDKPLAPFVGAGTVTISKGITAVSGIGTDFVREVAVGTRIAIGDQVRTVRFVEGQDELTVVDPWSESVRDAPYTVFPVDAGAESIMVVYGPPVPVGAVPSFDPPPNADLAGRDPFLVNRSRLNFSLFNALTLARDAKNEGLVQAGYVAITPGIQLDANLNTEPARILATNYDWAGTNNPQPYRLGIDRASLRLRALQSSSVLADNYWGDSTPSGTLPDPGGAAYDLLYNVAARNAVLLAVGNQPGWWVFDNGDESFLVRPNDEKTHAISGIVFNERLANVQPDAVSWLLSTGPYSGSAAKLDELQFSFVRTSTSVIPALARRLLAGGVARLLTPEAQLTPELPFNRFYVDPSKPPPHVVPPPLTTLDFGGAYGAYFDELFLFIPWLVGDLLKAAQQFESAKAWYEYVFDPTVPRDDSLADPNDRYWRYLPFRNVTLQSLEEMLTDPVQIAEYNDAPFDPDAIAQLRRSAYAKAVVLRYIDDLIAWGDARFAEDTRESIEAATQLYVLASDLLGARPKIVGRAPVQPVTTFREIRDAYGEQIPQFIIDLENTPVARSTASAAYDDSPINDIQAYFCVPENVELVRYWDTVEDRLYKIRHCMNIQGVERPLALFAPPLDVRDLIAGGGDVPGGSASAIPYYRFLFMLDRAKAVVGDVVNFGSAVFSALQSKDNEALLILQNSQQRTLLDLNTRMKEQAVAAAQATGRALEEQRANAVDRRTTYADWLQKGPIQGERDQLAAMTAALVFDNLAAVATTASAIAYTIPQVGSPFAMTYGGIQLGSSTAAIAAAMQIGSIISKYIAERGQLKASWARRDQEWELQQRLAASDERQAAALIAANDANLDIARRDLQAHLQSIAQNRQLEDYLRRQFTTEQLFSWMAGRLSTVHFQAYLVALATARAVERSLQYELDLDQRFITGSYWDSQKRGLLSGEALLLALDQMERAYIAANARRLEIVRPVSLKEINPKALLDLKAKGECMFETPERLFDSDYPGHYARKIKAVTVTVTASADGGDPAPVGPISAMLTQLGNQTVLQPKIGAVSYLLGKSKDVPGPDVLRSNVWASQQIAVTSGDAASGMFDFFLADDRYLPFEGTGAVASWRFSMPQSSNGQPLSEIDDVVLTLSYTALDGGARFRGEVLKLLEGATAGVMLGLRRSFPAAWSRFVASSEPRGRSLAFSVPHELSPPRLASPRVVGVLYQALAAGTAPKHHEVVLELGSGRSVRVSADTSGPQLAMLPSPMPAAQLYQGEHELTVRAPQGKEPIEFDDIILVFLLEGEIHR